MKRILTIFRREVEAYFVSPVAWAVYAIFLVIGGYFFYTIAAYYAMMSLQYARMPFGMGPLNLTDGLVRPLFHNLSVVMLLVMPLLTMRLLAEEKKMGTIELLFTYPLRDIEVVAGKWLAGFFVFALMLALTFPFPLMLYTYAEPDTGAVVGGYLGLLLMGAAFLTLGMFTSALTENQIVAAVTAFGALLMFWIIGWGGTLSQGFWGKVFSQISLVEHFDEFTKGVFSSADLSYYVVFIGFFAYLTLKFLETRKWRS